MSMDCITFRSITPAQRSQRLLQQDGVQTSLQRTPRQMGERSCGYCLRLRSSDRERAVRLLEQAGIGFRGIYNAETGEKVTR